MRKETHVTAQRPGGNDMAQGLRQNRNHMNINTHPGAVLGDYFT